MTPRSFCQVGEWDGDGKEARWVHSGAVTTVEDGLDSVGAL